MSHLKDIWNDFTRSEPPTANGIRTQGRGFLLVGVGSLFWFLVQTILSIGEPIAFRNVVAKDIQVAAPALVQTSFGKFGYSEAQTLYYETSSFLDRLIFTSIGSFNLVDFLFFVYIGILLFRALNKVHEDNVFQLRLSKAYLQVGKACVWMAIVKMAFGDFLVREYFQYRTGNQFYISPEKGAPLFFLYITIGGIIISFVYFMNKGEDMQRDNDLTI
jgi:hypothetical protein